MELLIIHIIKSLGTAIVHSLWQIAILTLLYFYFILAKKQLKVNRKYTAGMTCLLLSFLLFALTIIINTTNAQSFGTIVQTTNINYTIQADELLNNKPINENNYTAKYTNVWMTKVKSIFNNFVFVIGVIWILGIGFQLIKKLTALRGLNKLKYHKQNIRSGKWEKVIAEISKKLNLKQQVDIIFSPFINSPLSFGLLKPVILFPLRLTTGLTNHEIKHILIHELAHNLKNHHLHNIFQNAVEILFFYHPGILLISKEIRLQREIICDALVLESEISHKQYANTLLKLSELRLNDSNLVLAAKRNENELLTRIKYIFSKPDNPKKHKSSGYVFIIAFLLTVLVLFIKQATNERNNSVNALENVINKQHNFNGSFALYDFNEDKYFILNDSICKKQYPAFSTFKIVSSLIALDMGIATNENFSLPYDSVKHPLSSNMQEHPYLKNWCKEHNMVSALNYSVNWFYKELDKQIGKENKQTYLNNLNYGNKKISPTAEPSWYNGKLKISAFEQVTFLKNLFNNNLNHVSKKAQIITKSILPKTQEETYSISAKTGTGGIANNKQIGWYIGYLETKNNTYAFALNIFDDNTNSISQIKRHNIVESIFSDMGLISK